MLWVAFCGIIVLVKIGYGRGSTTATTMRTLTQNQDVVTTTVTLGPVTLFSVPLPPPVDEVIASIARVPLSYVATSLLPLWWLVTKGLRRRSPEGQGFAVVTKPAD
jgi:hypothetical protein